MQKLSEALLDIDPGIDLVQAKKIINAYRNVKSKANDKYCEICHVELNDQEKSAHTPYHFLRCCDGHAQYRVAFQVEVIQRQLGLDPLRLIDIWFDI